MTTDDLSRAAQRAREAAVLADQIDKWLTNLAPYCDPPASAVMLLRRAREVLSLPSAPDRDEVAAMLAEVYGMPGHPDHRRAAELLLARGLVRTPTAEQPANDHANEQPSPEQKRLLTDDELAAIKAAFETGNYLGCDGEAFLIWPDCKPCEGTGKRFEWDDLPDCPHCGGMGKVEAVDGIPLVERSSSVTCTGCGTSWEPGPMVCPECERPSAGLSVEGGGQDAE